MAELNPWNGKNYSQSFRYERELSVINANIQEEQSQNVSFFLSPPKRLGFDTSRDEE